MNLRGAICCVLAVFLAPHASADERAFSACRIEFVAKWVASNCPGKLTSRDLATTAQVRTFAGGTTPDCYRGEGDAKNDVERMVSAGGKAGACAFYTPSIKEMAK
jgi:hypothetical protein